MRLGHKTSRIPGRIWPHQGAGVREGGWPFPNTAWTSGIHSPMAMRWGHFSSHSRQAVQALARSPLGMNRA
jgi:hypothetical protein